MRKLAVGSEEPNPLLKFKRPYQDTEQPTELAYPTFYRDAFFLSKTLSWLLLIFIYNNCVCFGFCQVLDIMR